MTGDHARAWTAACQGEVLICFAWPDEPVPRGFLGSVDWILGGRASRLFLQKREGLSAGDVFLLNTEGMLPMEKLVILALPDPGACSLTLMPRLGNMVRHVLNGLAVCSATIALPHRLPFSGSLARTAFTEGYGSEQAQRDLTFLDWEPPPPPQERRISASESGPLGQRVPAEESGSAAAHP
ncbi:MAG: hypothetical protein ACE5HK_03245 [Candidatus Methylomirabilales bacterium]